MLRIRLKILWLVLLLAGCSWQPFPGIPRTGDEYPYPVNPTVNPTGSSGTGYPVNPEPTQTMVIPTQPVVTVVQTGPVPTSNPTVVPAQTGTSTPSLPTIVVPTLATWTPAPPISPTASATSDFPEPASTEVGGTSAPTQPAATTGPALPTATTAPPSAGPTATATPVPQDRPNAATSTAPVPTRTSVPSSNSPGTGSAVNLPLPVDRVPIEFLPNTTSFVTSTDLLMGGTMAYRLGISAGQRMYLAIDGDAQLQVYDPQARPLSGVLPAINPVQVPVNQTGAHFVVISGKGPVTLSVYIPPFSGEQAIPAPLPALWKTVQFSGGTASEAQAFNDVLNMNASVPLGYQVAATGGETFLVNITGNATVALLAPDRTTFVSSPKMPLHQWQYTIPTSGTYSMVVLGSGSVGVNLRRSTGQATPTGGLPTLPPIQTSRVTIPAGYASAKVDPNLISGIPQGYVINVQQGQTLYAATVGEVEVTIYGPDHTSLVQGQASFPRRWSVLANTTGDYTFVISGSGPSHITFFVPPLR